MTKHRPVLSLRSPSSPTTDFWLVYSWYSERAMDPFWSATSLRFTRSKNEAWVCKQNISNNGEIERVVFSFLSFLFFFFLLQRVRLLQCNVSLKSRSRPAWSVKQILSFWIFYAWPTAKVNGRQDHWPRRLLAVKITDHEGYSSPWISFTTKVVAYQAEKQVARSQVKTGFIGFKRITSCWKRRENNDVEWTRKVKTQNGNIAGSTGRAWKSIFSLQA